MVLQIDEATVLQHSGTIASWGRGSRYQDTSGAGLYTSGFLPNIQKSPNLLDGQGKFFRRTRPQYAALPAASFDSVTSIDSISYNKRSILKQI